jgi:3-deoxy-D-manno-octulosonic-acid transferase
MRVGAAVIPVFGRFHEKLQASIDVRREAGDRLLEWARWNRDPTRPLAWFHASSVGEGLQAQSVLLAFRRLRPDCQVVYTHFSPSAAALAQRIGADADDYLPWDMPENADRLLSALAPTLLVFVKLDVWPELSTRAATSGVAVALVAGTVSEGSGRLRWPVRRLIEPGYRAITAAAAISPEDARRLAQLGVASDRIRVLGDPRFDSVAARVRAVPPDEPLLRLGRGVPTLVAGSTWPADEVVLLRAFEQVHQWRPDTRLILVPHEPTPSHLERLERIAAGLALPAPQRLSSVTEPVPLLLVDRVGVLAALYGSGTMAYVGGGFGRAGLHSVLEPAAWGMPVAFGPRWRNSRDAALLLEAGAAVSLPGAGSTAAAVRLRDQWTDWIRNEEERQRQGRRARGVVEQGTGSSAQSAQMLVELLGTPTPAKVPEIS